MRLHPLLQVQHLFEGARERAADVDDVQYLQRALWEGGKVAVIAAERCCADIVTADVKDDTVPVQSKRGGHLGRERERLDAGAGEVRRNEPDFLLLDELAALGETEVGIDHIEVDQLRPVAAGRGLHGEVQRQLTLAAAVVADEHLDVFHVCLLSFDGDKSARAAGFARRQIQLPRGRIRCDVLAEVFTDGLAQSRDALDDLVLGHAAVVQA